METLDLYRIFYVVAKSGSLTKASEELYISQPAISHAIKKLESKLGVKLFYRNHQGMKLTAQGGVTIFRDVEQAIRLLDSAEGRLSELLSSASGTLRIGASEAIFQYVLTEKIVEYHNSFPNVRLELYSDVSPRTVERLKSNEIDIAFFNLPLEEAAGVSIDDSIFYLNDIFVASNKFSELREGSVSIKRLREYPLILLEENTVARASLKQFTRSLGFEFEPLIEVDSWGFMKRLVTDGMGIGCIPREYVRRRIRDGLLFEIPVEEKLPVRSVGMALPKDDVPSFAQRAFVNLFKKD